MTTVLTAVREQQQSENGILKNLVHRSSSTNYSSLQLNPSAIIKSSPTAKYVSATNTIETETEKKKRSRSILHGRSESHQQGGILGLLYTIILYIVHILYMSYILCQSLQLYLKLRLQTYSGRLDDNDAIVLQRIQHDKRHLTKLPKHVTIHISRELSTTRSDQDWENIMTQLSKATCWAYEFGIREISVYDSLGMMKSVEVDLYKKQSTLLHNWINEISQCPSDEQKDFKFTILSAENGKRQMEHVAQKLIKNNTTEDITVDLVDKQMRQGTMSDPDLMIVYDGLPHNYISLDEYPPWYIRLTEIANCTSYHCLDYNLFSKCLYRFSKVEQRFGR